MLLQSLRSLSRNDAATELKKVPKGKLGNIPLRTILDALYSVPRVLVTDAQVQHAVDKESGKSIGTLRLKLEVDQHHSKKKDMDNFSTCVIVLGTSKRRMLLAQTDFSIGYSKRNTSVEKEVKFDWDVANADGGEGGGSVVLRILQDSIRGMDSELQVKLR
jgi:hypothetical protein